MKMIAKIIYPIIWLWVMCTHPTLRRYWLFRWRQILTSSWTRSAAFSVCLAVLFAVAVFDVHQDAVVSTEQLPVAEYEYPPGLSRQVPITGPEHRAQPESGTQESTALHPKRDTSGERWLRLLTETGIPEETWLEIYQDVQQTFQEAGSLSENKT